MGEQVTGQTATHIQLNGIATPHVHTCTYNHTPSPTYDYPPPTHTHTHTTPTHIHTCRKICKNCLCAREEHDVRKDSKDDDQGVHVGKILFSPTADTLNRRVSGEGAQRSPRSVLINTNQIMYNCDKI